MWIFLLLIFIAIIAVCNSVSENNSLNQNIVTISSCFKKKDYVMTYTELQFYKELLKVTDKLNLVIFPKIRLADLIFTSKKDISGFNRIKSKHIDFVLCDKSNCKIRTYIELDDYSHNRPSSSKNDNFKDTVFGKSLIRIKVSNNYILEDLELKIKEAM